jgi:antitoxin ParD1/3/4
MTKLACEALPRQAPSVKRVAKAGEYQNASEAIRNALRVLRQKRREDALKLRALREHIRAGLDALERGDFTEVSGGDLDGYLEELAAERRGFAVRVGSTFENSPLGLDRWFPAV